MTKHPFNGSTADRRDPGRTMHYEGTVMILQDKTAGRFHTSYSIHMHDGHGTRTTSDRTATVVGAFETEQEALNAGLEHAKKYFK